STAASSTTGAGGATSSMSSFGAGGMVAATNATVGPTAVSSSVSTGSSGNPCFDKCFATNPAGAAIFQVDVLEECACKANTCTPVCMMECVNPKNPVDPNSQCGQCLAAEEMKKTMSMCLVKAALQDCAPDPQCSPLLQCLMGCP